MVAPTRGWNHMFGLVLLVCVSACGPSADGGERRGALDEAPIFEPDPSWPGGIPARWVMKPGTGMHVDSRDHVWMLYRPEILTDEEIAASQDPSIPGCCVPAPPLIELDPQGNVVQAWGSIVKADDWPMMPHGLFVDHNDFVWVSSPNYHQVMKFTRDGQHLLTIGEFDRTGGSNDISLLGGAAGVYVDPETNELFVADGYDNRRVIVYDAATSEYVRHWGAYGQTPDDDYSYDPGGREEDSSPRQFQLVHGVEGSRDGLIYVADRTNSRVQVFDRSGDFIMERVLRPGEGGAFDVAFSPDPGQRFLYVADGGEHRIWILRRSDLEVIGEFGVPGKEPGQLGRPHNLATDSDGNIYVAEAEPGRRFQKFIFKGVASR